MQIAQMVFLMAAGRTLQVGPVLILQGLVVTVLIMVTKMVVIRAQITHCAMLVMPRADVRPAFMVPSLAQVPSVRVAHRLMALNMEIPMLPVAQQRLQNVLQMWVKPIYMKITTANFIMQA